MERAGSCAVSSSSRSPIRNQSLAIASVMGAPLSDAPRLHHWSNGDSSASSTRVSMASEIETIERAVGGSSTRYATASRCARAATTPSDDLISRLIAAADPEPPARAPELTSSA